MTDQSGNVTPPDGEPTPSAGQQTNAGESANERPPAGGRTQSAYGGPAYGRPGGQPVYPMQPPLQPPRPKRGLSGMLMILFGIFGMFVLGIGLLGIGLLVLIRAAGGGMEGASFSLGEKIGLIRIEGVIQPGSDMDFWLESLRDLGKQRSIRGVVVRINSPGGAVGASQELQAMVLRLRHEFGKPVYVSMGDVAASGGYYIAAGADRIYALKGTLTGSIGVLMEKPDLSKLAEKLGVDLEIIKSGRFKDAGSITRELTPQEREMFDKLIMNTYNQFLDDILSQRTEPLRRASKAIDGETWAGYQFNAPLSQDPRPFLTAIADGRAYTGEQALQLGLVDKLGTLDDTILALGERLHMTGWPKIQSVTRRPSLRELFQSKLAIYLPAAQAPLQYRMNLP